MAAVAEFPEFKPLELQDRPILHELLWRYQPETSELTFTNLFIWRDYYGTVWSRHRQWLLLVFSRPGEGRYGVLPIGPPPRVEPVRLLLGWLKDSGESQPRLERVDRRLIEEVGGSDAFGVEPTPEHSDYVYRTEDLAELAGRKYHSKRNFINTFRGTFRSSYEPMTPEHVPACLDMAERWCQARSCSDDMGLAGEATAIREALQNFSALEIRGGVIKIEGAVEAFTFGELLNSETAVVHIEKANPERRGLYAVINQQFCEQTWRQVPFINREQDLGEPQLRQAKQSYYPHHMVDKFRLALR